MMFYTSHAARVAPEEPALHWPAALTHWSALRRSAMSFLAHPPIKKICKLCEKEYEVPYRMRNKSTFCSKTCSGKHQWLGKCKDVHRTCQHCGIDYVVPRKHIKTSIFCSRKCAHLSQAEPALKPGTGAALQAIMDFISYDPNSGLLTWKKKPGSSVSVGSVIGNKTKHGRSIVDFRGMRIGSNRVAWCLFYKEWPKLEVDHINGDPSDDRISNLRLATRSQNVYNQLPRSNTGHKGVRYYKGGFEASIKHNGTGFYLGRYRTLDEAVESRKKMEAELGVYDFCHRPVTSLDQEDDAGS